MTKIYKPEFRPADQAWLESCPAGRERLVAICPKTFKRKRIERPLGGIKNSGEL